MTTTPTPGDLRPEEAAPPAAPPPIPLGGRRGGRRRRLAVAGGVAAAALVGLGVLAWRNGDGDDGTDGAEAPAVATATAEVTTRDLEDRTDLNGTLGYGDTHELALEAQGTLTWLPAEGTVIDRGQTVAEVDDKPIPLLLGDRPLWRELGPGVDDGRDVELVESNLVALGIVSADDLTVDQEWTSATTQAVEDWQEALGLEETGRLRPADVVVQPAAVRVTDQMAEPGGPASGPALSVGGTTRQVTVDLDATRQQMVQAGQKVEVELPDGSKTNGTIASVGTVAEIPTDDSGQDRPDATPTVAITVTLDDPAAAGTLDQAPVKVWVVTSAATGVLAVPVDALLALAEGGYAVERVVPGGTELVAVELGAFADGWVQVTGDVADGDEVVVPA
ncbi:MAG TPA: peptidoglycan-binding protein [Acidimicrobiales bacterium]